ncbi:MAG: MFS transporter [Chloroflexi bacterium]|nr:MFS transporter [Chloroflexota bacterium]
MTRRQLALAVYLPTFFLAFGQGVVLPTMPLYAKEFNPSVALISVAVAALAFGTMLADLPMGMLLDRVGRRPMMLAGTTMLAVSYVGLAAAQVFPELVAYRLISGVGTACWGISRLAFMTDAVAPENRGRALSTFGGLQRIGTFVGPAVGGVVAGVLDLRASFVLAAVLALIATGLSWVFVPETRPAQTTSARGRWQILGGSLRANWKDFAGAAAAQVFAQMIRSGRQLIVPLYGSNVLGLSVTAIGTIISISAIIDMSLFLPAGMLMDRLGRKFASIPSFLVMAIGMAMLPLADGYVGLLAATAVIGLGNGLGSGTMMTLGADLAPREAAGEFLGLWRLVGDGGAMSGPLIVGGIAGLIGFTATAFVLSGIGVLAAGTIYVAVQETLRLPAVTAVGPEPKRRASRSP